MRPSCSSEPSPSRAEIFNFASGPGQLPRELLRQAAADLLDWQGSGQSVLELPFGSQEYRAIAARAERDLRALLDIPGDYRVLFLQGGAYAHMALLAMNLLVPGAGADYVITGHWSARAAAEGTRYGRVRIAASGEAGGFTAIPAPERWRLDPQAAYCHITSNETAQGLQFQRHPDTGEVPLVADMTSDFLSRPVAVARYGLIYASAQKNAGAAGLTILIVRDSLLREPPGRAPAVFDYARQAACGGRVNTPPVFAVYFAGLVFAWLLARGGLEQAARAAEARSRRLYELIDASGFYRCPAAPADRSRINVCFRLPEPPLERLFVQEAVAEGLLHLAGHEAAGGIRASLYNAMPAEGVERLAAFMEDFARRHPRPAVPRRGP